MITDRTNWDKGAPVAKPIFYCVSQSADGVSSAPFAPSQTPAKIVNDLLG
ncbi:hypothetical protein COMA1_60103 [Candidatus Nitrospira nitrosa]|uniref:Uncharacterized protein n=1 Tax=Candidatus Nitrospira nitrosa TaxID=1742972 RepID=A0A0S4LQD0_9BACT|nr:hypothetical protein COMA1_60103 [Candidatus Nitrospira nitrosa]